MYSLTPARGDSIATLVLIVTERAALVLVGWARERAALGFIGSVSAIVVAIAPIAVVLATLVVAAEFEGSAF